MAKPRKVPVAGAAGYVGSHVCVVLAQAGYDIGAFDNLCNSSLVALKRVGEITGREHVVPREAVDGRL